MDEEVGVTEQQDPGEVVVEIGPEPTAAIIWLHGLGADGNDFASIVPELGVAELRFVFPHAPMRPITVNGGMTMRGWFDIDSLDRDMSLDLQGLQQSISRIHALVQRERDRGIADDRILIAGFSQGGTIALLAGLTLDPSPAGILALSTFIPVRYQATLAGQIHDTSVPIFMAHGSFDPVVQMPAGKQAAQFLVDNGLTVDWHEYGMPHAVCPPEVQHIGQWLRQRLR
jgi:phospholipase/carboxylesterase